MHSLRNISASSFRRRVRGGCGSISKHRTFAYASIRKKGMASIRTEVFRSGRGRNFQPVAHGLLPEKTGEKEFLTVGAANRNTKTSSGNASPVMSAMIPNLPNVYGCRAPSAAKPYSCCAITIRRNIDSTYKFKHYETVFTLYCNCVGHVQQHFPG